MSATRGYEQPPSPPFSRGVSVQAKCEKCESTETPTTSAPIARNSETRSEKAMISVCCRCLFVFASRRVFISLLLIRFRGGSRGGEARSKGGGGEF